MAVGGFLPFCCGDGLPEALAELWNGQRWVTEPTPMPLGKYLSDVSCVSPTDCTALDFARMERWNGRHWSIAMIPGVKRGGLEGISCTARATCTAVGRANNNTTLAEQWNGTRWSHRSTPNPTGATSSSLAAVSCTTTTTCIAVGSSTDATGQLRVLVERWTSTSRAKGGAALG
jgi:hypothetical protein